MPLLRLVGYCMYTFYDLDGSKAKKANVLSFSSGPRIVLFKKVKKCFFPGAWAFGQKAIPTYPPSFCTTVYLHAFSSTSHVMENACLADGAFWTPQHTCPLTML